MYPNFNMNYLPQYQYPPFTPPTKQNKLPPQQALKANGKASIDMLEMSPDSDVLIMDTTAPRVWYCVSDGLGNVKAIPYRIEMETDLKTPDMASIEERVTKIESILASLEAKTNDESYVKQSDTKPIVIEHPTNPGFNEYGQELRKSADDNATAYHA